MIRFPLFGLVFLLTQGSMWAQAGDTPILIERMTAEFIDVVRYQNNYQESGVGENRAKWMEIRAIYEVRPEPMAALDDIQFKVYVEGVDIPEGGKARDGLAVLLTGESSYINVGKGRWAVAFYVHPSTLAHYGGMMQLEKKNVHLEAYSGGKLVASKDKKEEKDPNWFESIKNRVSGSVYTKDKSPFAFVDLNAYPAAKLDK